MHLLRSKISKFSQYHVLHKLSANWRLYQLGRHFVEITCLFRVSFTYNSISQNCNENNEPLKKLGFMFHVIDKYQQSSMFWRREFKNTAQSSYSLAMGKLLYWITFWQFFQCILQHSFICIVIFIKLII